MKEGYTLRPYQQSAVDFALDSLNNPEINSVIIVRPTGTGKTILMAAIVEKYVEQNKRVLILAHRNKLLEQAHDKIESACGIDSSYEGKIGGDERVVICSIQSMSRDNRLEKYSPDYFSLIIVDETHHIKSPSYEKVRSYFSGAKLVGVTATPVRGDGHDTRENFDVEASIYTTDNAIEDGYLTPIRVAKIPMEIDISRVHMQGGDYSASDVGDVLDRYLQKIAIKTAELTEGKKTIIFTPLVRTAQKLSEIFNTSTSARADYVAGERKDSDDVLERFENGEIDVLCNAMLLCLDKETEVLTDKGFVKYNEITYEHKVANWTFDGSVYFEKPKNIIYRRLDPSEHMVSVESRTKNFRVTNLHKMVVKKNSGTKKWQKVPAEDIGIHYVFPTCGVAKPLNVEVVQENKIITNHTYNSCVYNLIKREGYTREEAYIEATRRLDRKKNLKYKNPNELTLDECKFIGFWIADGSVNHLKRSGVEYTLCQTVRYPNICDFVDNILDNIGIDYIKRPHKSKKDNISDYYTWSLPRGTGGGTQERKGIYHLEPYLDKNGSQLLWGLNEEQFDALLEGYWLGDGHHGLYENGFPDNITMNDTRKPWIELLCAIGSVRGWGCSTYVIPSKNKNHKEQYLLHMIKNRILYMTPNAPLIHEEYSEEDVWCVTTSSNNIITRRNGRVMVMGNCEGYDCPSIDCIINLRPTRSKSLYVQMIGRALRLFPCKDHATVLDFLWQDNGRGRLNAQEALMDNDDPFVRAAMEKELESGEEIDFQDLKERAVKSAIELREAALADAIEKANALAETMSKEQRDILDALTEYAINKAREENVSPLSVYGVIRKSPKVLVKYHCMSASIVTVKVEDPVLAELCLDKYDTRLGSSFDQERPTTKQLGLLEKFGIPVGYAVSKGHAGFLIDGFINRSEEGLGSYKQIKALKQRGVENAHELTKKECNQMLETLYGKKKKWKKKN